MFRPCLTLAIDDEGRRWIAEGAFGDSPPGPIWCIFPDPQVALYASDDLTGFLSELRRKMSTGDIGNWLRDLTAEARSVWKQRTNLALTSGGISDPTIRAWAATLPSCALVYDLRRPSHARGWPYGVAGPAGRLYRCGRAPVFAVSGPPPSDRWTRHLSKIASTFEVAEAAARSKAMPGKARAVPLPVTSFAAPASTDKCSKISAHQLPRDDLKKILTLKSPGPGLDRFPSKF